MVKSPNEGVKNSYNESSHTSSTMFLFVGNGDRNRKPKLVKMWSSN